MDETGEFQQSLYGWSQATEPEVFCVTSLGVQEDAEATAIHERDVGQVQHHIAVWVVGEREQRA
jgi:hypothetical protein